MAGGLGKVQFCYLISHPDTLYRGCATRLDVVVDSPWYTIPAGCVDLSMPCDRTATLMAHVILLASSLVYICTNAGAQVMQKASAASLSNVQAVRTLQMDMDLLISQ